MAPPAATEWMPHRVIPARAVAWAILGFVVGEVLGGVLSAAAAAAGNISAAASATSAPVTLAGEIGLWSGFFGACLFVSRRYGSGSLHRDYGFGFRPVDLAIGAVVAVTALVVDTIVAGAFLHTRFHGSNTQIISGQRGNSAGFVVVTLIAAVGAPFFEELLFRGLIRTALRSRIGPTGAVIVQAALFGLAHFQPSAGWGNVSVVVGIGAIGLVLGFTAERTGRLGAGMVGHGLFNLIVAVITLTT
jgi:membrane protease YdiL (CAAX protease family)